MSMSARIQRIYILCTCDKREPAEDRLQNNADYRDDSHINSMLYFVIDRHQVSNIMAQGMQ